MRRGATPWLIALVAMFGASRAEAGPMRLTLEDVVTRATTANIELRANRKDLDVATANLERSKALLPSNPYLTGGSRYSQHFRPDLGVFLSQEFEIAGQRQKRIDAAAQNLEKTTWEAKSAEQSLVATAKAAFIHALVSADRVTLAQQAVDTARELARQLEESKLSSDTQRIDLNVAQIQEGRARRELATAQSTHATSLDTLRGLLGLSLDQEVELVGAPETEIRELPPAPQLVERALQQRPDLAALRHDLQRTDLQIALAKRERIPNVTVTAGVSRFEGDTLAGGDIGVPIPIFHDKAADVREATAERGRVSLQIQNLESDIEKEVREALRTCAVTAGDLEEQQREIVPKSEENLRLQRRQQDRGRLSATDVVGAEVDLFTARREYLDAVESYNKSLIELERVVGGDLAPSSVVPPPSPPGGEPAGEQAPD